MCHVECLGREAQWGLERSFKGLVTAGNDPIRFRRDAAFLWRHVESVRPIRDRKGTQAMANLLAATATSDGSGCRLTAFSEAYRRNTPYPEISDEELAAAKCWIEPALDGLITEALTRSGAARDDLHQERRHGLGLP